MTRSERIEKAARALMARAHEHHITPPEVIASEWHALREAALAASEEGQVARLVVCGLYRHGSAVGLLHLQNPECLDPTVATSPNEDVQCDHNASNDCPVHREEVCPAPSAPPPSEPAPIDLDAIHPVSEFHGFSPPCGCAKCRAPAAPPKVESGACLACNDTGATMHGGTRPCPKCGRDPGGTEGEAR